MRFRYPEQRGRNVVRLLPVVFFFLSLPFAGVMLYEYFAGLNQEVIRPVIAVVFVLYFGYRARFAMEVTFIRGEGEG